MLKFFTSVVILGIAFTAAVGQSNRSVRPRVAPTPTPAQAPVLDGGTRKSSGNAPVLIGGRTSTTPVEKQPVGETVDDENEVIRVDTNLVTMPVSVLDRNGRFISGLSQRDFRIFENGIEQKIEFFESVEQPFTVVLLIDVSPSTKYQIDEIHNAAISFVDQLRPNDRVMVMAFDQNVQVLARPTNNRRVLYNAIREANFGDGTSLYEAVDQVMRRELRSVEGRKAVVLFTDGVDTTSRRASYQSTVSDVEEFDALFYTIRYDTQRDGFGSGGWGTGGGQQQIGIGGVIGIILGGGRQFPTRPGRGRPSPTAGSSAGEYATGKQYLETIARTSGGRSFEADTMTDLDAAFSGIAEELRRQYSIGYSPDVIGRMGERKQIRVQVARPNVVVRAKTSYIVGDLAGRNLAGR